MRDCKVNWKSFAIWVPLVTSISIMISSASLMHKAITMLAVVVEQTQLWAYCLGITDVDPLALNLYFERFLNPERTSPPDFDIDFSYTDRDEVMDYIFNRYGKKM